MTGGHPHGVRLTVLGSVRVWRDGVEAELGHRPQLMLALLLARAGQTVSVAELIDLVWGTEPPAGAPNMLHRYIGAIRRAMEPGLPFRAEGTWLAGMPGGYRLRGDPAASDLMEFRRLVLRATAATAEASLPDWAAALSLWHGPYAQGLADPAPAAFTAMDRERAAAARAAGAAARQAGAVGTLLSLVQAVAEQQPLDESLAAEVIRLLAAQGRPAEASAWYARTSAILAERLGVEPGPMLSGAVEAPQPPATPAPAPRRPAQLPSDLWLFSGRAAELAAMSAAMDGFTASGMIAVDGIPGVGKSTLAIHWAHTVAGQFPDGQLFANLRGHDPSGEPADPADILVDFLDALGASAREIPEGRDDRSALFRTLSAGRKLLVVLDNARTADQVRPLIPAAPGCLVLVTSRTRLTGLAAHRGATMIGLDLPAPADARTGLRLRLGGAARDFDDGDLDRIIQHCGRLPLAIAIVAARAHGRPYEVKDLLAELRESRDNLDAFDDHATGGVRSVFGWSYSRLSPDAARLFRLLPAHAGPDLSLPMLASLAARPRRATAELVRELLRARLVSELRPGRHSQHDLIKVYAAELAAQHDPDEREPAAARALGHLGTTIDMLSQTLLTPVIPAPPGVPPYGVDPEQFTDLTAALNWFRAEMDNLRMAVQDAYRKGRHPWRTVVASYVIYLRVAQLRRWEDMGRTSLAAAVATGDRLAEAHLRTVIGDLVGILDNDTEAGIAGCRQALTLFGDLHAEVEQAAVHVKIANIYAFAAKPDYAAALPHCETALRLYERNGQESGRAEALSWLGRCQLETGEITRGTATLVEALDLCLGRGELYRAGGIFLHLASAAGPANAVDFLLVAHRLYREVGSGQWSLVAGLELSEAYLKTGRRSDAYAYWRRATDDLTALTAENSTLLFTADIRDRLARLGTELTEP